MDLRSLFGGLLTPDSADAPAPLPMDPMDQALPPHLRQFYGSPGSAPTLPPPALNRPQPGQTETPREVPLQEKAMAAARSAYNDVMSGAGSMTEGLLGPLERGVNAVGDAARGAAGAVGDVGDAVARGWRDGQLRGKEKFYTDDMNAGRAQANWPPLPPRDPSDPYYGHEYPQLKRPQPGQDWSDDPPIRGEEWYARHYTPQERRRVGPLKPNGMKRT